MPTMVFTYTIFILPFSNFWRCNQTLCARRWCESQIVPLKCLTCPFANILQQFLIGMQFRRQFSNSA